MKRHALVTNDDGIQSAFLHHLVEALLPHFQLSVAAPAFEQSWKGRSVTRSGEIQAIRHSKRFPPEVSAWAINGTPTDCVNIALGNLLKQKPDIVVSGINIGYNMGDTIILSSGTIAGAIEGALWNIPAIAFSQYVPNEIFERIRETKGQTDPTFARSLKMAAAHAANLTTQTVDDRKNTTGSVVNVNFPVQTNQNTSIVETSLAKLRTGSLFTEISPGRYTFRYAERLIEGSQPLSDRAVLEAGKISRSVLNFSQIG